MKKLILFLPLLLTGCPEQQSKDMAELGEVYDVAYMPAGHGSGTGYNFSDGSISYHDVTIPARYAVIFKCKHGKFVIDGPRGEDLYNKLEKGQAVTISYQEVYEVENGVSNLCKLHFVDAVPTKE